MYNCITLSWFPWVVTLKERLNCHQGAHACIANSTAWMERNKIIRDHPIIKKSFFFFLTWMVFWGLNLNADFSNFWWITYFKQNNSATQGRACHAMSTFGCGSNLPGGRDCLSLADTEDQAKGSQERAWKQDYNQHSLPRTTICLWLHALQFVVSLFACR